MDDLMQHPEVSRLMIDGMARLEKLDNYRFRLYLRKPYRL
jgi:hypothetical protein